jgi:hypothetical protein
MEKRQEEEMENPPLWVWAIVVGLIIAGKYAYRWKTTNQLAKEMERRENGIGLSKDIPDRAIKKNNNNSNGSSTSNVKTTMSHKYSRHKYSPSSFRDYFEIRKRKVKS